MDAIRLTYVVIILLCSRLAGADLVQKFHIVYVEHLVSVAHFKFWHVSTRVKSEK